MVAVNTNAVSHCQLEPLDDTAFEQLVTPYSGLIYWICLRILENEQDAEDATQETFVKVFRSITTLRDPEMFPRWLASTARRTCYDMLDASRCRPVATSFPTDNCVAAVTDNHPGPEEWILACELCQYFKHAFGQLSRDECHILILRDIEEQTYDVIATEFDITVTCAKTRVHRARVALRRCLEPYVSNSTEALAVM